MDESRKAFEQWFQSKHKCTLETMKVMQIKVELAWEAWQASRAAIEIDLPEATAYWNGTEGNEVLNHRQLIADTADAIRAAGIKVKE
ncbi:TPA: hypothetical protein ACT91U_001780 [Enterobacter hormaechei subsp. steigerwaltii]